jgi:hypothetical protein
VGPTRRPHGRAYRLQARRNVTIPCQLLHSRPNGTGEHGASDPPGGRPTGASAFLAAATSRWAGRFVTTRARTRRSSAR